MVEDNYFINNSPTVDKIKHFPYKSFAEFKENISNQSIVGISVPMDYARNWITQSSESPIFWHNLYLGLMAYIFCLPIFYILFGIFTLDLSAIIYTIIAVVVAFTGSPFAMKVFKVHYLIIGIYLVVWLISGSFPGTIYWLPILFQYFAFNQLYKGSASIVRGIMIENEKVLCLFWKWYDARLLLKDGNEYSQRGVEKNGKFEPNEDVQKEWEQYYKYISEKKLEKNATLKKSKNIDNNEENPEPTSNKCNKCGSLKIEDASFCTNCGQKIINN